MKQLNHHFEINDEVISILESLIEKLIYESSLNVKTKAINTQEVIELIGVSRTTFYDKILKNPACNFPKAIEVIDGKRAWLEHEVRRWLINKRY
jgi:predicted DNA-binding transcriptional regulator AlpA